MVSGSATVALMRTGHRVTRPCRTVGAGTRAGMNLGGVGNHLMRGQSIDRTIRYIIIIIY